MMFYQKLPKNCRKTLDGIFETLKQIVTLAKVFFPKHTWERLKII